MTIYAMTLRPVHFTSLPEGVSYELTALPWDFQGNRPDLSRSQNFRYGEFSTSRPLTAEELEHFDIRVVS